MGRYFVPAVVLAAVSGLAFVLIAVIVARSPYTHGNLSPPDEYTRTPLSFVGEEYEFHGLGLDGLARPETDSPEELGRYLFIMAGCALCHGPQGQGGVVGPDLREATRSEILRAIRKGPKGMPSFTDDVLSDDDRENIVAYLLSLAGGGSQAGAGEENAAIPTQ